MADAFQAANGKPFRSGAGIQTLAVHGGTSAPAFLS